MKTRTRKISRYLYVVEVCKLGVWIDFSTPMPLCDAKALSERLSSVEAK